MKNFKKVIALVVMVVVSLSYSIIAYADTYSDVSSDASYYNAVDFLSTLSIIKGYEDSTFQPDKTVTRAEAATIMVRLLGLDDGVEKGNTIFTDVDNTHWASGYINIAVDNGIVNGMGDGTFAPDDKVTYEQIVKMIVCALGYEPYAEATGGWTAGGYIVAGSRAGFTRGVAATASDKVSRATVAQLIYNACEIDFMDKESLSIGIYGPEYDILHNKTILSEYLELEKIMGSIVEVNIGEEKAVKLVITKYFTDETSGVYWVGEQVAFIYEGIEVDEKLGHEVTAWVGKNKTGNDTIFAMAHYGLCEVCREN